MKDKIILVEHFHSYNLGFSENKQLNSVPVFMSQRTIVHSSNPLFFESTHCTTGIYLYYFTEYYAFLRLFHKASYDTFCSSSLNNKLSIC